MISGGSGESADGLGGGETVDAGHADVHQHHVRLQRVDLAGGLGAVARLAHDPQVVAVEQDAQAGPDQRVVIDHEYPGRRGGHAGHGIEARSR